MIKYFLYISIIFTSAISSAIEPINNNISEKARELLTYFESTYQKKVLSGYNHYVHTPNLYEQTGINGAIFGMDVRSLKDIPSIIKKVNSKGHILSIHWHWHFNNESAWESKRATKVNIANILKLGASEHKVAMTELKATADKLEVFKKNNIPILWRPFHEIDGGWFWWTDHNSPENTAKLWVMMFEYFVNVRKLDNLIWVYSASIADISISKRKLFYPGEQYVDISGIDVYGVDFKDDTKKYNEYFNIMSEVSPGKMLALGEADAIPNPELMKNNKSPSWLYVLPWWGTPHAKRPVDWALYTTRHEHIINLRDLPPLSNTNIKPDVSITPQNANEVWFPLSLPAIHISASDRDGEIGSVSLFANNKLVETKTARPFIFMWDKNNIGSYKVHSIATDNEGKTSQSNSIQIIVGKEDAAKGRSVIASSGKDMSNAVDGNIYTSWNANKTDDEWIYIDLGQQYPLNAVNLHWGWKIHPSKIEIEIAQDKPQSSNSWSKVYEEKNIKYQTWKAAQLISFPKVEARYLKLRAYDRAGNQKWGGFQLTSIQVPVEPGTVINKYCILSFICV
jgi:hypothetical protein